MVQLLYIVSSLHVLLCPFTKVEESFNIQSFHDILYNRFNLSEYDHNEFPGVVPRTFLGPLFISALSSPVVGLLHLSGINKFWTQYVVRLTLALAVIAAWSRLRNTLQKLFGNTFAWWFTIITVSQYHFMFYMSRPLPNIMALPLVLLAYDGWLSGKHKQFIISAGAAIIIFRSELAMLFGLLLILDLYFKKLNVVDLLKVAVPAGICLILLTICIDSVFWGRLVWPEAEVFWFNTILNKSSDWGTSPFLWYFYSALPRGLGPSIVLLPIGAYLDRRVVPIIVTSFVYILLFSLLPHKELRFIIYVFPLLNVSSAITCSYIYIRRSKAPVYELLFWILMVIIVCNVIFTSTLVLVAMTNYPGGVAMTRFHKLLKNEPYVHVHISNLAAQTGVTKFTQIHDHWYYSKNESLSTEQLQYYTHLIVEAKSKYSPSIKAFTQTHTVLDSVESFSHIAMNYKIIPPIKIKSKAALFILERKNFRDDPQPYIEISKSANDDLIQRDTGSEEIQIKVVQYDNISDNVSEEQENSEVLEHIIDNDHSFYNENLSQENTVTLVDDEETERFRREIEESILKQETTDVNAERELPKAKVLNRSDRKKKAIEKIKSETRKEVVASAKEKLKELMKRHKHVAKEITENDITNKEDEEMDGRGDIPEQTSEESDTQTIVDVMDDSISDNDAVSTATAEEIPAANTNEDSIANDANDHAAKINELNDNNIANENIDSIVEEVITRLIDRKIYDDRTKPEDIKIGDRKVIQKIVEEILSERMNFNSDNTQ
ncbi:unnamed protein product [Pieris brassicae]|uniref:Mannosyltransferase n=1 Tax=Pieris brassicae TaxID=7116 RepID=A0A9P0TQZ6_PIEBR|nr:unnamed protein product [Pieris brassicae]